MKLIIIGFIIGVAKIIPGVSGSMLAISFGLYERTIEAVTHFFDNYKENLKFLLLLGSGILLAIITCSKVILFFLTNYYLYTILLFLGLIIGGIINFSKEISFSKKNILLMIIIIFSFLVLSNLDVSLSYEITNSFFDNIIFFLSGVLEVFSSLVPGISGTVLFLLLGIYDEILLLNSSIFDVSYVINNINLYISYGMGMSISFIIFSYIINYLFKRYRAFMNVIIFSLCIGSLILMILLVEFVTINYFIALLLFISGFFLGKKTSN